MAILHEVIGAFESKKSTINTIIADTKKSFSKTEKYQGHVETFIPLSEGENGVQEIVETTSKNVETTVKTELLYLQENLAGIIDLALSREETNSSGKATSELVVNGVSFGTYSATTYLCLLDSLRKLRELYNNIPLRDTAKSWTLNENTNKWQTFVSDAESRIRTKKKLVFKQFDDPTGKHAPQIKEWTEDVPIGKMNKIHFSGGIDVSLKANILQKIDELISAAENARIRANQCEAVQVKLMNKVFDYIHKDLSA